MTILRLNRVIGLSVLVLLAMTSQAEAAGATLGDVLNNVRNSLANFPDILSGAAYLLGLFFFHIRSFQVQGSR